MFARKPSSQSDLDPNSAFKLIQENKDNPNFIILDVRTPGEFNQSHIEGSVQLDYQSRDFEKKLLDFDKNKIYLVYCRSGMRSGASIDIMAKMGFKNLYNMAGGIMGWENCGLPLKKP
ncbi:MAG: rhodanese-like domain-containing protein [Methanobacteriaceae archaeon]|nr:rhodanese-like domain-containing protein [Methanobacteriaceae archaeon]